MNTTETFKGWHNDDKNKPPSQKIEEAAQYLSEQDGEQYNTVLVNEADMCDVEGFTVVVSGYVRPNNYFIGYRPPVGSGGGLVTALSASCGEDAGPLYTYQRVKGQRSQNER